MAKRIHPVRWFLDEVRLIGHRWLQVWSLTPAGRRWALGGAAGLMALASLASTMIPLLLGGLVGRLAKAQDALAAGGAASAVWDAALFYLGLIGAIYLAREAVHIWRRYLVENTCTRIDRDLTVRTVGHLLRMQLDQMTHEKVGALQGRVSRSVDGFVRFLRLSFLDFLPAILTGLFALTAVVCRSPLLGLVMLGVVPASVALTVWQLVSQKNVRLKLLRSREEMDGAVVEQLGGLDYIRAADTVNLEVARVARTAEKRRGREIRHHFEMSLFGCYKALNEGFFHLLVLGMAIWLAARGEIAFPEILTYSMLFLNVMTPLTEVHRIVDEGHESSLRVGDLLDLLATPSDRSFEPAAPQAPRLDRPGPLIAVDGLEVEYLTADGQVKRALDGVSLQVRRGERLGVAGRSGSGKSTWLKVLLRLTHPCGGRVQLGGVPIEEVRRADVGRLAGYVGQQPFVFAGTIEENIAYGVPGARPDDVRRAAEMACIHEEILAMPRGFQAQVAERGQNLSGGQRQRLALARLFLKNPPLLILDEATSALDTISERCVQKALSDLELASGGERTVIVVAHRLSTLLDCDRILVFDHGRIAESGTYHDLVQRGGLFAELLLSAQTTSSPPPAEEAGAEEAEAVAAPAG